MVSVTFVTADGASTTVEGRAGDSVMYTAQAKGITGIVGECGGAMACATCHCHVDADWIKATGPRQDGEEDMLECAATPMEANSRLSCQIRLSEALDGLVVHLPATQF